MESYKAIPIFVAVAKNQSFSAGARELGLSKSAISKRISQLEASLGTRLLHRTTRKLSLTEAGQRFYQHGLQVIQAAQNAEDSVAEIQGQPVGVLKIQVPMSFGVLHVAPIIPLFLKKYPNIKVDLIMEDQRVDIIAQGYDICIRSGELEDSTLIARKLVPLRSVICLAPSYSPNTELLSPTDLAYENCILYSYSANANQWEFVKNKQSLAVRVSGNYKVNNSEAVKQSILAGAGIGRLPSFVAGKEIAAGKLIQLFSDYAMPAKQLYAIYPERHYVPAKVRAFIDFTIDHFGSTEPYWDEGVLPV